MIFFRIRRHSPAAASRFAPLPRSTKSLAAAIGAIRDSLAILLSSLAEHAFAGLAHVPDTQCLPGHALVHRHTSTLCRPPVATRPATVHVPAFLLLRKGGPFVARFAIAIVVAGGFGTLCLSYALACVTISSVLLSAVA